MTPNLDQIFEHIEVNDEACSEFNCHNLIWLGRQKNIAACDAVSAHECPRARFHADEVRQFISRNQDMLIYVKWG